MIDQRIIETVTTQIVRQFPEMAGVKPKVRLQVSPQAKSTGKSSTRTATQTFLLTFQTSVLTINGKMMSRWVRVVITPQGKILKITTSR